MTSGVPLFTSTEEMQEAINAYFASTPQDEWTITGLALSLGTTRRTLLDYEAREEYGPIVKLAKTKVEHAYELSLRKSGRSGDIFALKNFGWRDRQELAHSEINSDDPDEYTDEQLDEVIRKWEASQGNKSVQ